MNRKPLLALDYVESKLVFPLGAQPKIDGVRGLNMTGSLTARSLKPHRNAHTTAFFSRPEYVGLDGEFAAEHECHPRLCSLTTSAVSTREGTPFLLWHVFDYITEDTVELRYQDRYNLLEAYVYRMHLAGFCGHLRVVPMEICRNLEELLALDEKWIGMGYEGTIVRNLNATHKEGRSTLKGAHLLRIKRFIEEEAIVLSITEGQRNDNVAQINELGKTFRSSHQENKVPNGQVGSMECGILKDSDLFKKGQIVTVAKGEMTEEEAGHYFRNPHLIVNQIIKFKHFPKGVKNKPRFPTFRSVFGSVRAPEDM